MLLQKNGFEFDSFFVDTEEKVLPRDGKPLSLTPCALKIENVNVKIKRFFIISFCFFTIDFCRLSRFSLGFLLFFVSLLPGFFAAVRAFPQISQIALKNFCIQLINNYSDFFI